MLSFFGFGKKARKSSKSKSAKSCKIKPGVKKPPSCLLRICKKLKIKVTMKRGSKRVYKSPKALKKQCLKKLKALKKLHMKGKKSPVHRRKHRKSRRSLFGSCHNKMLEFGAGGKRISFGKSADEGMEFGKKSAKMSKAQAMKAFKAFYQRHCSVGGSRFGNGGNPPLYQSMGYEFCPLGSGGVLGYNSTGLFPSPCTTVNRSRAAAERRVVLPKRWGGADKMPALSGPVSVPNSFGKKKRMY